MEKKTKDTSKEPVITRAFAILMQDEHGEVIYTFKSKKNADEFYDNLSNGINK